MTRSKRAPIWTDGYGTKVKKLKKRSANRAVRKSKEVTSGKSYKKEYSSWDICDYKFRDGKNPKAGRK